MLSERTIGVIGSGIEEHDDLAREVGLLLASLGVNLLTGGGRGVMTSVSRAFTGAPRRRGICIGIIPCRSEAERTTPKDGYPNAFIELPVYTHLPHSGNRGQEDLSRNHIIILSSTAIIALPGSEGTASEMALAIRYGKSVIAFSRDAELMRDLPTSVRRANDISDVEEFLRQHV